jgi:uncharacterized protein YjbI with pentapeptide repeats
MALRKKASIYENLKQDMIQLCQKVKEYPLISLLFVIAVGLLIVLPYLQVSLSGIENVTEKSKQENQARATLAQIFGGSALGIGLYYTWRRINIAEEGLRVAQESQITERFTRAVDQLGNEKIEIKIGGIYALERISTESEKYYWLIIELLTAYVRENSPAKQETTKVNATVKGDIQAILTVIGKRKHSYRTGEIKHLNLSKTNLKATNLSRAKLSGANLTRADLSRADLSWANLTKADLSWATLNGTNLSKAILPGALLPGTILPGAIFIRANLSGAKFSAADLSRADLSLTNLSTANLSGADLSFANLSGANLTLAILSDADLSDADLLNANLSRANLKRTQNLTIDQLSKVKTLYDAILDEELEKSLKGIHPTLFEKPK